MIEPEVVQRGLNGQIISRFAQQEFHVADMNLAQPGIEKFKEHCADLAGKGFFNGLVKYAASRPAACIFRVGGNTVLTGRKRLGDTRPFDTGPGTIKGDF